MGAMQAQDFPGMLWSIGLRLRAGTEAGVEEAIADRKIVRTWPMRGTLHIVAAEDVSWMLKLLTPRILAGATRRHEELELDLKTFVRAEKALRKALSGGNHLPRQEVFEVLRRGGIPVDPRRGYHLIWRLAQEGVLCHGPRSGKEQTFTLLDEWIPEGRKLEREAALAELAQRYFTSHGPATVRDLAWWSGLTAGDARTALEHAAPRLASEKVEGREYWFATSVGARGGAADAFLLPGFDEYMLGYQDRCAALDPQFAERILPGGNGVFMPTLVSKGKVVGTWKRTMKAKSAVIAAAPFEPLGKAAARTFAKPLERYCQFLGVPASLAGI